MSLRTAITTALTLSLALAAQAAFAQAAPLTAKHRLSGSWEFQQGNPPQTKPDPKTESKPDAKADPKAGTAAGLAGMWDVNIENPNGAMQATFDLKADAKDAKKITGTISSPVGEAPLEGTVVDGKLTFSFTMNANGTDLPVAFAGTLQKDGSLAGTLEYGQGPVPWTAMKQKK
jgi:hypothetical protein